MYRNIQTFAFKVLQECSSWASRNGTVQILFLTPNWNMFAGKFVKLESLLAVLRERIISNAKWDEIRKMGEVFEQDYIVKCVILFAIFCWFWDFLLENLKLKTKLWWCSLEHLDKHKNVCPKYETLNIYILVQILFFGGTALGRFSQCFFKISCRWSTMVGDIFNQSPTPPPFPPPPAAP